MGREGCCNKNGVGGIYENLNLIIWEGGANMEIGQMGCNFS